MGMCLHWHLDGALKISMITPSNGGGITLTGPDGSDITIFTRSTQWWSLYCVLPKTDDFFVVTKDNVHLHDKALINAYLSGYVTPAIKEAA